MEEATGKIYKKVCGRCSKEIISLSKSQCEYNFLIHDFACKKKNVKNDDVIKEDIDNVK